MTATVSSSLKNSFDSAHEVINQLSAIGFGLHRTLENMLNETPEHQSPRRGCGFTQASRFLADIINRPRHFCAAGDWKVFSGTTINWLKNCEQRVSGRPSHHSKSISDLRYQLECLTDQSSFVVDAIARLKGFEALTSIIEREESRLIIQLLNGILGVAAQEQAAQLTCYKESLSIGTCPEAERYFLEYAGGYIRRHGVVNIICTVDHKPIALEKMNIGDSHSCLTLAPVSLNGVLLPSGSLLGAHYTCVPLEARRCAKHNGLWLPITACEGFRFLRLSTLSVSPTNRARAFGQHLKRQLEGSPFFDPLNTTLDDLMREIQQQ